MQAGEKILQLMPAGGWKFSTREDGELCVYPLVGWGLTNHGDIIPLTICEDSGAWDNVTELAHFKELIAPGEDSSASDTPKVAPTTKPATAESITDRAADGQDYRIGKEVAVKYAGTFEGIKGRVTKVLPSGSHGIEDDHGVFIVQIGNNLSLLAGADQFRTA